MPRISLIHATPLAIDPVVEAFTREWPEAEVCNLLEDSLASDLARDGEITPAMTGRFVHLANYVRDNGADAILFTCSAFGASIEAAAQALAPVPVLKPNQAMFEDAIRQSKKVGMVATFAPSIPSMERWQRVPALSSVLPVLTAPWPCLVQATGLDMTGWLAKWPVLWRMSISS